MIVLCRVDHRLLHGQVAFSWTNAVGANCILIASDRVVHDEMWKTTLKLGKPVGTKLVIKNIEDSISAINSGITDTYNLIIVVQTIHDVYRLSKDCPSIMNVNLGGTKKQEHHRQISKAIFISQEDEMDIRDMISRNIAVGIQQLPSESNVFVEHIL